jgi:hypothetical protein
MPETIQEMFGLRVSDHRKGCIVSVKYMYTYFIKEAVGIHTALVTVTSYKKSGPAMSENRSSAVTRIRTWVVSATTRSTNHYTITANWPDDGLHLSGSITPI